MDKKQALELFEKRAKIVIADEIASEIKRKVVDIVEAFKELNLAVIDDEDFRKDVTEELDWLVEAIWNSDNEIGTIMNMCAIVVLTIVKWSLIVKGDLVRAMFLKQAIDILK